MFTDAIKFDIGDVVDRDGFVFADLLLREPVPPKP